MFQAKTSLLLPVYMHHILVQCGILLADDAIVYVVEMDDVRVVLRDMTDKSLVMMDEIGKGTSARYVTIHGP